MGREQKRSVEAAPFPGQEIEHCTPTFPYSFFLLQRRSTVSPPKFSFTKSPVLKPAPV